MTRQFSKVIDAHELLSATQELELIKQAQQNNKQAFDKLIFSNLRLVLSFVNKHSNHSHHDDLVQQGIIGLIKAIERFDVTKDTRFATYARWWIEAEIRQFILDNSYPVKVSSHKLRASFQNYSKAQALEGEELNNLLENRNITKDDLTAIKQLSASNLI